MLAFSTAPTSATRGLAVPACKVRGGGVGECVPLHRCTTSKQSGRGEESCETGSKHLEEQTHAMRARLAVGPYHSCAGVRCPSGTRLARQRGAADAFASYLIGYAKRRVASPGTAALQPGYSSPRSELRLARQRPSSRPSPWPAARARSACAVPVVVCRVTWVHKYLRLVARGRRTSSNPTETLIPNPPSLNPKPNNPNARSAPMTTGRQIVAWCEGGSTAITAKTLPIGSAAVFRCVRGFPSL